ncbi:hypothetical protein T02_4107 [Trichinella nativa]|uniref:Uncharacterized protein n=1 Tax=Trichinella nativa TaxID=6335 RepID=A0A0V1KQN2_9BILA|nr:hypothetical protein T02_4107 [Trichinella nativa]
MEAYDVIQFMTITKNQQKLVYRERDREAAVEHCPQIWKPHNEHAESCPVNPHAFYHHQQLAELRRLASENTRPVMEIYNELASNSSIRLDTSAHYPTWDQARHTMYNRLARKYPRLLATGQ